MASHQVTLREVAERAGVSIAAVSKALNGKTDIADKTRDRLRMLAEEMGYCANVAASPLVTRRHRTIGVLLPFPHIPMVTERLRGIQRAALARGYLTSIAFHDGASADEIRQIELLSGRIDGLIITPSGQSSKLVERLRRMLIPLVLMSESLSGITADYVGDNDHEGGRIAGRHFQARGQKHLLYLGNSRGASSDQKILRGLRRELSTETGNAMKLSVCWQNLTRDAVCRNLERTWLDDDHPDAIFGFSDMPTIWAMNWILSRGLRIPDDIAVLGYDDSAFAELAPVPLSCIAQPNEEIGFCAMNRMLDRLEAPEAEFKAQKKMFSPVFVQRDSA